MSNLPKQQSDISNIIRNLYPKIMPKYLNLIILKEHKNMFLRKLWNWIKKIASTVFQLAHMLGYKSRMCPVLLLLSYVCFQRECQLQHVACWNTSPKYLSFISGIFALYHFTIFNVYLFIFHELKWLVLCSVKKHETYDAPIKSKEELIFHVGFRQFVGRYGLQFEGLFGI